MSDSTIYAEALIAAVTRAFYPDDAIAVVDVLLRDKFLRDDDMGLRLSLQPKQLRKTLQFLQDEMIVKTEDVDDLVDGGSQATRFWYIDYNQAVHTIRLRTFLLKQRLEQAELAARSSSFYLCPGYKTKRCNGRYTEEEAQSVVDPTTGLFLCRECYQAYEASPNPPALETYTLELVDNAKELQLAIDNMRRVNVQLGGKMISNYQLRPGIYDALQKVRSNKGQPLTSNLPSENKALGIGSKRLAGTGRTAGIKAKKRAQLHQGNANHGATGLYQHDDLLFLKNAIGQEISFSVEKGGGTRAQLLATNKRRRRKLMDAAASRVAATLPVALQWHRKRQREKEEQQQLLQDESDEHQPATKRPKSLAHLENNIGQAANRNHQEWEKLRHQSRILLEAEEQDAVLDHLLLDADKDNAAAIVVQDDETLGWTEEERKAAFHAQYKIEMERQVKLLELDQGTTDGNKQPSAASVPTLAEENGSAMNGSIDEADVAWEDG